MPVDSLKTPPAPAPARLCPCLKPCGEQRPVFNSFHSVFRFPRKPTCGKPFRGKTCAGCVHKNSWMWISSVSRPFANPTIPPTFSREKRRTSALILRKTVDLSTIKRRLWITLWINAAILTDFCGFSTEIPGKFLTVPGNLWKTIQPRQNRQKVFQSPSRCILSKPPCMKCLRPRSRGGCLQYRSVTADPGASLPRSCRSRSRPCCGPS